MRLLFCTQALDLDHPVLGFAHEWIARLAKRVERVIVVPVAAGRVQLPANVDVRPLHRELGGHGLAKLRAFARIVGGACSRREVDAVFAHMVPRYAAFAAPFARPRGIPIFLWYTHKGVDWSLRLAEPCIARAYTASASSFRLPSTKKVVTGHGIDTTWFVPPRAGAKPEFDVAVVGRIAPVKDPLTLVEALGVLAGKGLRPRVVLAGDTLLASHDAYRERVLARIDALGLRDQVTALGNVPHERVRDVFHSATCFVTPSLTGSVDKTVLEAMSCARIALTCNESFHEVFGPLAPRLMFGVGAVDGLAALLSTHLTAPQEERDALGRELRDLVVRDHDLDRLMDRLVADMGGVLAAKARR
ncbi:MAG: glycosyltransferase [Planctomycetes bacterium]|nr:glycosyltransferase [Planctomycetota bacterium]